MISYVTFLADGTLSLLRPQRRFMFSLNPYTLVVTENRDIYLAALTCFVAHLIWTLVKSHIESVEKLA
jgi:hypothetical protein